jgi:hypothetical protein
MFCGEIPSHQPPHPGLSLGRGLFCKFHIYRVLRMNEAPAIDVPHRAFGVSSFSVAQMERFRQVAPLHVLQPPSHGDDF